MALKVLSSGGSSKLVERFLREARALARLRHSNIVSVHEVASEGGFYFYTMDLVEGYTLADELERGVMTTRRAAEILRATARAIQHAHESGIIHRDLKPTNILLTTAGEPMVADFGIARDLFAGDGLTKSGEAIGTAPYMAPEQAAGRKSEIDARTDVYALGALLYECLTGRPPFDGESAWEVQKKVQFDPVKPPRQRRPDVPESLEKICLKALQKRREDRYQTAGAMAEDLDRFLGGKAVKVSVPRGRLNWSRVRTVAGPGWLVAGVFGLVALLAILAAWVSLASSKAVRAANERLAQARARLDAMHEPEVVGRLIPTDPSDDPRELVRRMAACEQEEFIEIDKRLVEMKEAAIDPLVEAILDPTYGRHSRPLLTLRDAIRKSGDRNDKGIKAIVHSLLEGGSDDPGWAAACLSDLRDRRTVEALIVSFRSGSGGYSWPEALNAITGMSFAGRDEALGWWERHKSEFPTQILSRKR